MVILSYRSLLPWSAWAEAQAAVYRPSAGSSGTFARTSAMARNA